MKDDDAWSLMGLLFQSHPWHGIPLGEGAPDQVTAYIELVPTDTVKYEVDKVTGHLKLDRPQEYSNVCPTPYGFLPQTYCGADVAAYARAKTGRNDVVGDEDPLDICVLTEKVLANGNILLQARPIGGFRMIDHGEADDKIIAVLAGDALFGPFEDISDCPEALIQRLRHYFLTYKQVPGEGPRECEITDIYGAEEAREVIRRSQKDYTEKFPGLEDLLVRVLKGS